jgi:hypothetical protein
MLVYGDGSTTTLLQQIAGSTLVGDVLPSFDVDAGAHPFLAEIFTVPAGHLRIRHPRLRDGSGAVVSGSLIAYRTADFDTLIPPEGVPLRYACPPPRTV